MFTTTKQIAGREFTTEWPDHVRPLIMGTMDEAVAWLRTHGEQYGSKGKEYSAVYWRVDLEGRKHPEWCGMYIYDSPEWHAQIEAKKSDEYKAWSLLSKALKAMERRTGFSFLKANPKCGRCNGTGHVAMYAHVAGGVCFSCFPG